VTKTDDEYCVEILDKRWGQEYMIKRHIANHACSFELRVDREEGNRVYLKPYSIEEFQKEREDYVTLQDIRRVISHEYKNRILSVEHTMTTLKILVRCDRDEFLPDYTFAGMTNTRTRVFHASTSMEALPHQCILYEWRVGVGSLCNRIWGYVWG
jgi:hypothetical protein